MYKTITMFNNDVIARSEATRQSGGEAPRYTTRLTRLYYKLRDSSKPRFWMAALPHSRWSLAMTALAGFLLAVTSPALEFPKYEKVTKGNTTVLLMKQDRVPLVSIRV